MSRANGSSVRSWSAVGSPVSQRVMTAILSRVPDTPKTVPPADKVAPWRCTPRDRTATRCTIRGALRPGPVHGAAAVGQAEARRRPAADLPRDAGRRALLHRAHEHRGHAARPHRRRVDHRVPPRRPRARLRRGRLGVHRRRDAAGHRQHGLPRPQAPVAVIGRPPGAAVGSGRSDAAPRVCLPGAPDSRPREGSAVPAMTQEARALVECESLVRIYQSGSVEVQALQGLDLLVDEGEMVAVVGAVRLGQVDAARRCSPGWTHRPRAGCGSAGWDLMAMPARTGSPTGGRWSGSCGSRPRATCCRT